MEWSGVEWSGAVERWRRVERSGVEWIDGVKWSGVERSGVDRWSRVEWSGPEWIGGVE